MQRSVFGAPHFLDKRYFPEIRSSNKGRDSPGCCKYKIKNESVFGNFNKYSKGDLPKEPRYTEFNPRPNLRELRPEVCSYNIPTSVMMKKSYRSKSKQAPWF